LLLCHFASNHRSSLQHLLSAQSHSLAHFASSWKPHVLPLAPKAQLNIRVTLYWVLEVGREEMVKVISAKSWKQYSVYVDLVSVTAVPKNLPTIPQHRGFLSQTQAS